MAGLVTALCRLRIYFLASTIGFGSQTAMAIQVEEGEISYLERRFHLSLTDSGQNRDL